MAWTWKWFDMMIAVMALVVGFGVWFIPNFMNSKEMKDLVASQNAIKAQNAAYEAQQAAIKAEQEELGLVFLPPPPPTEKKAEAAKKAPTKTAAKLAPAKSAPKEPTPVVQQQ